MDLRVAKQSETASLRPADSRCQRNAV